MPAPKPSGVVTIATLTNFDRGPRTGSPSKVVPPDLPNGLVPGDPATPEPLNYLHNLAAQWQEYLRDFEDRALNWGETSGGAQSFFGQAIFGNGLLGAGSYNLPRFEVRRPLHSVVSRVLLGMFSSISNYPLAFTGADGRLYSRTDNDNRQVLEITINALWNGTNWVKDVNGFDAARFTFDVYGGFTADWKAPAQDTAWTDAVNNNAGWTARNQQSPGVTTSGNRFSSDWRIMEISGGGGNDWELKTNQYLKPSQIQAATTFFTAAVNIGDVLPPFPVQITNLILYLQGGTGHGGTLTGVTLPQFELLKVDRTTGALSVVSGPFTDNSASAAAYEAYHNFDTQGGIAVNTDPDVNDYWVGVKGEAGSNYQNGLRLAGAKVIWGPRIG